MTVTQEAVVTATAARTTQLAIRAQLLRDVTKLWPMLDGKRLSETWPAWSRAMVLLVTRYHRQSSVAAAHMYRLERERFTQSPAPGHIIRLAADPAEQWIERALGYSGPGMLQRDTARPNTALSTTLGTSARIALDGARTTTLQTVKADPVAVGWYRVTDGDPCAFCALMASRGIAFKSEQSADFKAHNDCGCAAVPAFTRDIALPSIATEADRIYRDAAQGAPAGTQLAAFRKAWAERNAH